MAVVTRVLLVEQARDAGVGTQRIREQLERLGVAGSARVEPVPAQDRPLPEILHAIADALDCCADERVGCAVVTPSLVAPDAVLLRILDDANLSAAVLVSATQPDHRVATVGDRLLAAETGAHPIEGGDRGALGVVYLHPDASRDAASAMRVATGQLRPEWGELDVLDLVTAILVRSEHTRGLTIRAVPAEPFPAMRAADRVQAEQVRAELDTLDDRALAQRSGARAGDGPYSTFVLRRISRRLTPLAARLGLSPNAITSVSALLGVAGAAAFAIGGHSGLIAGALLLQASLVLDCVDGELARVTRSGTPFGAWLDAATDRLKEYAALAGLAVGVTGESHVAWTLAAVAMVVQTTRHVQDFSFDKGVLAAWRASFRDTRELSDTDAWHRPGQAVSGTGDPRSAGGWLRRVLHAPIGERWLVVSVAALAGSAIGALAAYLALSAVAGCWALLGALRRTARMHWRPPESVRRALAAYRDDGLVTLFTRGRAPAAAAGWLLPVGLIAVEGAAAVALPAVLAPAWLPAGFGWFAVLAWHRYDLIYRRAGDALEITSAVGWLGGGWALRTAVLLAAAAAGVLPVVLVAGIGWGLVCYVPESLINGARTLRRSR